MVYDVRFNETPKAKRRLRSRLFTAIAVLSASAAAETPITFTDIADGDGAGITYRRGASATNAAFDAIKLLPFYAMPEIVSTPLKPRGAPGVVVFDYDGDGDEDIFVTNGPGRPSSLYQNQLAQTGIVGFVDVGVAAGVGAIDQDSTGACAGDINNDGHIDLFVLGRMEPNRLFLNNGDGTFTNVTAASGLGGTFLGHNSCSMGDIDGDGLLDIAVGNGFDMARQEAIFTDPWSYNHPNLLYRNMGGNTFEDVSEPSGFTNLAPLIPAGNSTITWAIAMVDYDLDGDIDILHADDQAALPNSGFAGVDRGFVHILENDGTGHFTNVTAQSGAAWPSMWMGLSFGDINCDGHMDMFSPSVGGYLTPQMGVPIPPDFISSRWWLGGPGGTMQVADLGEFVTNPFGWGTAMADYDNDGDADIIWYGSLDVGPFITADNPGVILQNQGCSAEFVWDHNATLASAEKTLRSNVQGMAVADLNDDGFVDMVHVASQIAPPAMPLVPSVQQWGSVFDMMAYHVPTFTHTGPLEYEWSGIAMEDGHLGVQINSANNGNNWVKVTLKGSVGFTEGAKTNRSGIGAVAFFTPHRGKTSMSPVLGGSSYASQHSLTQHFGLGKATRGVLEILWPGGVRNRLDDVQAGERLVIPEIPCDIHDTTLGVQGYRQCVDSALADLQAEGVIDAAFADRLKKSARRAYNR